MTTQTSTSSRTLTAIIQTRAGSVYHASLIRLTDIPTVRGGYLQPSPTATLAIALAPADAHNAERWIALWEAGGDWDAVCEDDTDAAESLGMLDDANETRVQRLAAGAVIIRAWAERIEALDDRQAALADLACWMRGQADAADCAAVELIEQED